MAFSLGPVPAAPRPSPPPQAAVAVPVFPGPATAGPAAGGWTVLTPQAAADIPARPPYPPWVQVQPDGSLLVEGCSFTDGFACYSGNVTFAGCQITATADQAFGLSLREPGCLVSYCEISGPADGIPADRAGYGIQVLAAQVTISNCDIHDCAISTDSGGTGSYTYTANYLHDPGFKTGDHTGHLYFSGGMTGITITGNTVLNPLTETSCFFMDTISGTAYGNVTLSGNLFAGAGYCLYLGGKNAVTQNLAVCGNFFSTIYYPDGGLYGTAVLGPAWGSDGNTWENNTWYDGPSAGQLIAAP